MPFFGWVICSILFELFSAPFIHFMSFFLGLACLLFAEHWRCSAHNRESKQSTNQRKTFHSWIAQLHQPTPFLFLFRQGKRNWIVGLWLGCLWRHSPQQTNQINFSHSQREKIEFDLVLLMGAAVAGIKLFKKIKQFSIIFSLFHNSHPSTYCYNIFLFPSAKQASLNERKIKDLSFVLKERSEVKLALPQLLHKLKFIHFLSICCAEGLWRPATAPCPAASFHSFVDFDWFGLPPLTKQIKQISFHLRSLSLPSFKRSNAGLSLLCWVWWINEERLCRWQSQTNQHNIPINWLKRKGKLALVSFMASCRWFSNWARRKGTKWIGIHGVDCSSRQRSLRLITPSNQ